MDSPKVSVIIPVYNTAPYLREAVGSVMHQTLREIEILIVNDGSTDESGDILRELAEEDSRILVFNQRNEGQSVARNVGLKYATGEYIYFMDSDDVLHADALQQCYERCSEKQLEVLFFDGDILYEEGCKPLSWNYHRTENYDERQVYMGKPLLDNMLEHHTFSAVPWLYMLSRHCLECLRLLFYPDIIHEDELFTVLLFLQTERVGCLKRSLVKHRVRAHSTMTRKYSIRNVSCYLTVIDELFAYTHIHPEVLPLIRKYTAYTLNGVFETAFQLPFLDKCRVWCRASRKGYWRYIRFRTLLKFWLK